MNKDVYLRALRDTAKQKNKSPEEIGKLLAAVNYPSRVFVDIDHTDSTHAFFIDTIFRNKPQTIVVDVYKSGKWATASFMTDAEHIVRNIHYLSSSFHEHKDTTITKHLRDTRIQIDNILNTIPDNNAHSIRCVDTSIRFYLGRTDGVVLSFDTSIGDIFVDLLSWKIGFSGDSIMNPELLVASITSIHETLINNANKIDTVKQLIQKHYDVIDMFELGNIVPFLEKEYDLKPGYLGEAITPLFVKGFGGVQIVLSGWSLVVDELTPYREERTGQQ